MFKETLEYWKLILALIVAVVIATAGVISWAQGTKEDILKKQQEAQIVMQAQSAIVHNDYYQEGRIARKEDQINEHKRELKNLLNYIGDDEPTPRESRDIEWLDEEIARLRSDIEAIRVELETR